MITDILEDLASNMDDVIGLSVIGRDGISIASHFVDEKMNKDRVAAAVSQLIRQAAKSVFMMEAGEIEETITSTDKYVMIARPIGSGKVFVQLILTTDGNLGVARLYLEEYAESLLEKLPAIAR